VDLLVPFAAGHECDLHVAEGNMDLTPVQKRLPFAIALVFFMKKRARE
jgi:hypothetical protein